MFKRIMSLALALMLVFGIAAVSAVAAEAPAEQGAEAPAETGADTISFDASSSGWSDFGAIGFYVYEVGGDELIPWGSSKLFKSTDNGDGTWSFDASVFGMESGKQYSIIFVNQKSGAQTYDLMIDTSCFGDTAKCTGNQIENPVDSNKSALEAVWTNSSLGPTLAITSIGNVVGKTCPSNTTPYDMFVKFLKETLDNARTFSGKKDQQLLDDTAKALGLSDDDVTKAISEAGVTVEWKASGNSGSGTSSTSSTSSSTSSKSTTTTSSSSSSSTTKSGSASNTQTGQGETMLFIMLGVMVVAAGVIFFTRKRERA